MAALILLSGLLLAQAWVADPSSQGWSEAPDKISLTQAYTEALASGHACLKIQPDPQLLALSDPYDPEANQGYRLLDSSLYRGRYYIYFGVVPFVTLLVPWFKITGTFFPGAAAVLLYCAIGLTAYGFALWLVWRRWYAGASWWLFGTALVAVAMAGGTWPLLVRSMIYQIEASAAYAAFAVTVMSLVAAEAHPAARQRWWVIGALAAGLTIGCRPNFAPAVAVVSGWIILRIWHTGNGAKEKTRQLLGSMAPLAAIGLLLAVWNYIRFGSPFEFGIHYQLVGYGRPIVSLGRIQNVAYNLGCYLFGRPRLGAYFPFLAGGLRWPVAVPQPMNQTYGCCWLYPVLLLAGMTLIRRRGPASPRADHLAWLTLAAAFTNLGLLAENNFGNFRYAVDFLGPLSFAGAVGILATVSQQRRWVRRGLFALAVAATVWSAGANLCVTAATGDDDASFRSHYFAALARPFNAVAYAWEKMRGTGPRAIQVTIQLPSGRWGREEPLVVLGARSAQDFLYALYVAPGRLQLGFESTGRGGPVSPVLDVDYARPHTIELWYGSFLPPDDHPFLRNLTPADRALARRMITVRFDGRPVLDGWADFHPPRGLIFVGRSPDDPAFGEQFTGRVLKVDEPLLAAEGSTPRWEPTAYGPLRANLTLAPAPAGTIEPLLMAGLRNQGQSLLLRRLSDHRMQLGWEGFGTEPVWGAGFALPQGVTAPLVVRWGALLPPAGSSLWPPKMSSAIDGAKASLVVELAGRVVLDVTVPPFDPSPTMIVLGENSLQLSGIAPRLAGIVGGPGRLPWIGTPVPP